jgi:hypothetical protein
MEMSRKVTSEDAMSERECIHRRQHKEGEFYRGDIYVAALQRLRSDAAMKMASKVGAFFWSDAPHVRVWLCGDCAREVKLHKQT